MNLFGDIVKINNQNVIEYQDVGIYLNDCISKLTNHCPYAIPILWQVMPNHVHILLQIDKEKVPYQRKSEYDLEQFELSRDARSRVLVQEDQMECRRDARSRVLDQQEKMKIIEGMKGWLSVAIGGLKRAVTVYAKENNISFAWQPRFYDVLIKDNDQYDFTIAYISNNVNTWEEDSLYVR